MLKLECASLKGLLECVSFSLLESNICAILTETDFERNLILKVFTGLIRPDSGKVFIFGKDISLISYAELNELRKRMGIVLNNGGLVSNLKIWENLILPLSYHTTLSNRDMEEKIMGILSRVGYNGDLTEIPGPLPTYKKKLIGIARAMLMEPELIIYDSVFDGLGTDVREKVIETVNVFHREKSESTRNEKGRASLFLASSESSIKGINADNIYMLKKGRFYERN